MPLGQLQNDVKEFHEAFGLPVAQSPHNPPGTTAVLRWDLIKEEMNETLKAIANEDLEEVADGIIDSIYVLVGTALSFGIDLNPLWKEVHSANMNKAGGPKGANGKVLKPANWSPPKIKSLLLQQGMTNG